MLRGPGTISHFQNADLHGDPYVVPFWVRKQVIAKKLHKRLQVCMLFQPAHALQTRNLSPSESCICGSGPKSQHRASTTVATAGDSIVTQRLSCRSFLAMTCLLLRDVSVGSMRDYLGSLGLFLNAQAPSGSIGR